MIDHHVDRPDVEAQQWVELTGTNRSIGLIQLQRNLTARSDKRFSNQGSVISNQITDQTFRLLITDL